MGQVKGGGVFQEIPMDLVKTDVGIGKFPGGFLHKDRGVSDEAQLLTQKYSTCQQEETGN